MKIFKLVGFENYIIKDKIMYRKAHKVIDKLCRWKYISEREIKVSVKNGNEGYYLNGRFYPLKKLRHRLKFIQSS